ncbi:MAG: exonuclease SbcCD subunit D [Lentimicrobiaceae bacterium]|nr:exonuclease SbcCD subunit D [Lentimicrobiaceae bacterium]
MKLIHTSDWHLGQTLHQYSRDDEHKYFFNQLKNIILEEEPDVLIVSGDIFHSATPTVVSQRLYYHTLVELSRLHDDLQIIVVAGNHDSPSRLEAPRELWEAFNVTVIGGLDFYKEFNESELSYDASKIQIPVKRHDEIVGWVLAVPFINAGNYPPLKDNDTYSNRVFSFYNNLNNNLKQSVQFNENHSVVATGHFMMSGVNSNSYNKMIGGLESVAKEDILSLNEIDYWALGHVHHPQFVGENMRYSGSPFALTFNEIYPHSVTVVNIDNHNVDIKIREIEPLIPVLDFPSKPNSYDDALSVEEVLDNIEKVLDNECYVRLHVKSDLALSDVTNAKIMDVFEERKAKYCGVQVYLPENKSDNSENLIRTIDEFKAISPFELGCSVYKKKNNEDMPEEMKIMFKKVCDEIM